MSLKEAITKVKKPLNLIHTNVCNLIYPNYYGKNKYFVLFIDEFNIKLRCIF